jgi:uncharacterized alkaline shock family protein YloU
MEANPAPGKIFVAPGVLITVARLAALGVPGVARMSPVAGGVNDFLRLGTSQGVRIETVGDEVSAELYLVIDPSVNAREVAVTVQREVARAITDIIGMEAGNITIHIEDVDTPGT